MQIDPIAANAHRVAEQLGAVQPQRMRDVLFEHGELRAQAPRFPDVRRGRQPVRRTADDVAAKAQPRVAVAAARMRGFGLEPVEEAQTELSARPRDFVLARRARRRRRGRTSSRSAAN